MARNDRSIRALLTVIAVLLGANLLVNMNNSSGPRAAYAAPGAGGIPDTGAQFQAIVDSVNDVSKKVEKIDSFLESGNLSVKVQEKKSDK